MKKIIAVLLLMTAAYLTATVNQANACVGKTLSIGILNTADDQLLAEILSVLINERTGTTVTIRVYRGVEDVYQAVKKGEISILIENTERALEILKRPVERNSKKAYDISKEEFRKNFGLVWLQPFGLVLLHGEKNPSYCCFVITSDTLNNFPALPRVINKLSGTLNDEAYEKLIKSLDTGGKPSAVARDFLKSRKLI
jgi:glycine betaine/choline ABC-type transport system substrate-binding protein